MPDLDTYVPEGTRLKATLTTESAALQNPSTVISGISSDLEQSWNLHVEAIKDNTSFLFPQQYQWDLQLVTLAAFGKLRDVQNILANESWNLYKLKSLGVSVYSFQAPKDLLPQDTNAPKPAPPPDPTKPGPSWLQKLGLDKLFTLSTSGWITLGIVAVLIVMLLILAARPATAGAVVSGFGGSRGRRAA